MLTPKLLPAFKAGMTGNILAEKFVLGVWLFFRSFLEPLEQRKHSYFNSIGCE